MIAGSKTVTRTTEPIRGNRPALSQLTARTLGHGLGLVGIAAPERL
ncbi:DALR anticodon-binding domain-containing protein [Nocardia carnea]|nr:DALR anticodon-binding domain-containing protein [Nocardia carnea]